VNQSLSNTYSANNIKSEYLMRGARPLYTDLYIDEDISAAAVTDQKTDVLNILVSQFLMLQIRIEML
jgi:hypothetical protein